MRVLLDECVPRGIRGSLVGHTVRSVQTLGGSGLPDARGLDDADGPFDVIVTTDVRLASTQDLRTRSFAVLLLRGQRTSMRGLAGAAECLPDAMREIRPGEVVILTSPP